MDWQANQSNHRGQVEWFDLTSFNAAIRLNGVYEIKNWPFVISINHANFPNLIVQENTI